jgi:hypothetical protein
MKNGRIKHGYEIGKARRKEGVGDKRSRYNG